MASPRSFVREVRFSPIAPGGGIGAGAERAVELAVFPTGRHDDRAERDLDPPVRAAPLFVVGTQHGIQRNVADQAARQVERLGDETRSEEHTSALQSLMRISYAVFCLQKKNKDN